MKEFQDSHRNVKTHSYTFYVFLYVFLYFYETMDFKNLQKETTKGTFRNHLSLLMISMDDFSSSLAKKQ